MTKVLVVDDEKIIVNLLREFLQRKSYEVITASDGAEALEKVRSESPKVVLLDINMPGMSGLDVLQNIRQSDPQVGVIMVTAMADEELGRSALSAGAFDYIMKPFDLEYLEKVLWWKLQMMD
jgi:two-component system response regulator AtoC